MWCSTHYTYTLTEKKLNRKLTVSPLTRWSVDIHTSKGSDKNAFPNPTLSKPIRYWDATVVKFGNHASGVKELVVFGKKVAG